MAKELSEGVRGQIVALSNEGFSQRQIAAKIGVSKGAVQRTVERFRKTKSYSNLPRSGRPRCTTSQEDRFIKMTSLRNTATIVMVIVLAIIIGFVVIVTVIVVVVVYTEKSFS